MAMELWLPEDAAQETCESTGNPVRLYGGQISINTDDLSSTGYGQPWSHTRSYSNLFPIPSNNVNGVNWISSDMPYISMGGGTVVVMRNLNSLSWFEPDGSGFRPLYGSHDKLVKNTIDATYDYVTTDGTKFVFNDPDHVDRPLQFVKRVLPSGATIEVHTTNGEQVIDVRQTYQDGSNTVTESFLYDYVSTGPNQGMLERVTLRQSTDGGTSWTDLRKAEYTYYSNSSHGSLGDLETARRYEWDGTTWQPLNVRYYRYYKDDSTEKGNTHLIKFRVGPQAWQNMVDASLDPLTASDAVLSQYADHYYEYNTDNRVTVEIVDGGTRTYQLSFEDSSFESSSSSSAPQPPDYNEWTRKSLFTQPDGTEQITYFNFVGMPMLKIVKKGNDEWLKFTRFNEKGNVVLRASSAAINGYDEELPDLMGYNSVTKKFAHLNDSTGLITRQDYYTSTINNGAPDYLKSTSIQDGQTGTLIEQTLWEYTSQSTNGETVYAVLKKTNYTDTAANDPITTTNSYTFYPDTVQLKQKDITLPVITVAQNGSGTANTRSEFFDEYGNRIWAQDERGIITGFKYDIPTGAMTQMIADVDSAQYPDCPYTTVSGAGLNLVTDYEHDSQGRITQSLGPEHEVDIAGTSTNIRTASWTVYKNSDNQTVSARGYQVVSSGDQFLVNPVNISIRNKAGSPAEQISATRASSTGKLLPTDSFPQSSYVRWTTNQYTDCCKLTSTRMYHTIPASGTGVSGTNYDQTDFGYDSNGRQNQQTSPGGTITKTVFDPRSLPVSTSIGTDSTNMVTVSENIYDNNVDGGNGNLTEVKQHVDATTVRSTKFTYDFRNRRTETDGELDYFEKTYYDNLNRVTKSERYDTTSSGNLIAKSETKYDNLNRVYESIQYAVDPSTGTVGNSLDSNTWYDAAGNTIKSLSAGSNLFTKTKHDSLGRTEVTYSGYGTDANYAAVESVTDDTIMEQFEATYDDASNMISGVTRQRYHNATGTGPLQGPTGTEPKARVSYQANWPSAIGRQQASADYGTNGGTTLSRPSTIPTRSDTVLVNSSTYDDAGNTETSTDPAGTVTKYEYDNVGRQTKLIENDVTPASSSSSSSTTGCSASADTNRTTVTTYNADGNAATLQVWNIDTGTQITTYTYGTTLADSDIATSQLFRQVAYPDSTSESDLVKISYNRQGQETTITDQSGTIHTFEYDALGRRTDDRVTTLGTGVDGAVRRISTSYEVRSLRETLTSYDNASVGSGNIVNEVKWTYNDFLQVTKSQQSHSGAVTGSTPDVQYTYANGSSNTIRSETLIYPNGRTLTYNYGTTNSANDQLSRVESLVDDDTNNTHLVDYSYLGTGTFVIADETEPEVKWTMVDLSGTTDPDTGDIYSGFDRFGRIKDNRWYDYGSSADVDRIKYGYDRASNRLWSQNVVADSLSKPFDELYSYDGLSRLKGWARGTLNTNKDGLTTETLAQCWTMDETGNWDQFRQDDNGNGTWNLEQSRTANKVNEITDIDETTGPTWTTPAYSPTGNMTTIPQPADPTKSFTATWDAWNRLVKLEDDDTSDTIAEYSYDGSNRRIVAKKYSSGTLDETRHYYLSEEWQTLEERIDSSTTPETQYIWGQRYIDGCLLRDRDTNSSGILNERLYTTQDTNWTVTALIDINSSVQERFAYTPYGQSTVFNASFVTTTDAYDWTYYFTGRELDVKVLMYYFRNRYLFPEFGVFISRDPLDYVDGGSLYGAYFVPSEVDPSGLENTITVCVDQPGKGGDRQLFEGFPGTESFDAGHCFIKLKKDGKKEYSCGFYPVAPRLINPVFNPKSKGKIQSDKDRPIDVEYTIVLSDEEFKKVEDFVRKSRRNKPDYDVHDYNCVNWVLDCVELVSNEIPRTKKNYPGSNKPGLNPGDLGEDLRDLLKKLRM